MLQFGTLKRRRKIVKANSTIAIYFGLLTYNIYILLYVIICYFSLESNIYSQQLITEILC